MRVLSIDFSIPKWDYEKSVIEISNTENYLNDFYEIINCQTVDIVTYSEEYSIVVDDDGLLRRGNFIHQIKTDHGYPMCLAGKLIFVKNKFTKDGIEIDTLSIGDCLHIMTAANIRLIGVTK